MSRRRRSPGPPAPRIGLGGFLTGGIGLLAGAAIGGRRRQNATFLVVLKDGHHLAFEEKGRFAVAKLKAEIAQAEVKASLTGHRGRDD